MSVFVDTSAWLALASAGDQDHAAARKAYAELVARDERFITTSYVLAETMGLIQHRLGWKPLELFAAVAQTCDVAWMDGARHRAAEDLLFQRRKRRVNIVDAGSFTVMRELGLETAFAFDADFAREGFKVVPA
ncbi:MAG: PIN domain-containing protein [Gemmatimonadales bacterium]|nr:PIN domain-containing protein [Gemmatimonadales bacterium]